MRVQKLFAIYNKIMRAQKFTEVDRKLVLEELERIQKTKLIPIKSYRKLFIDQKRITIFNFWRERRLARNNSKHYK